jgi:hypothetical protein
MTKTSRKRRECLLECSRRKLSLAKVNMILVSCAMEKISSQDWSLWATYYGPLVGNDVQLATEVIKNNRSLSWLARELNNRNRKVGIS